MIKFSFREIQTVYDYNPEAISLYRKLFSSFGEANRTPSKLTRQNHNKNIYTEYL